MFVLCTKYDILIYMECVSFVVLVTDKGTKVCADPKGKGAILDAGGEGGPGPPGGGGSEQLVSDSRGG